MADNSASVARLVPFIERTFLGTHMLASRMRNELLETGEQEKLDALIADAGSLQEKIQGSASE